MSQISSNDVCINDFRLLVNEYPQIYSKDHPHRFGTDFQNCTYADVSTKLCSVRKIFADTEFFCFPRTCQDENIRTILRDQLKIVESGIECRNVDNPTMFFGFLSLFLTSVMLVTMVGTIFDFSSFKIVLPWSDKVVPKLFRMLSAFSLSENLKALFNMKSPSSAITCLNGIKALSMPFIVLSHSIILVTIYQNVPQDAGYERFRTKSLHINGILATDTFFFVSGILCAKFFIQRKNLFAQFFPNLFQRYMRLTPSAVVAISIFIAIKFLLMKNHPSYFYHPDIEDCKAFWWSSILHIQNYWNYEHMCFGSFWFATVSMQLFLVTPFFMLILKHLNLFFGLIFAVVSLIMTQSSAYNALMTIRPITSVVTGFYYQEAVVRSYPYFFGLFYYWTSTKITCGRKFLFIQIFGWACTTTVLIETISLIYNYTDTIDELHLKFLSVRVVWPLALSWLVHACHNGYGGVVNKILSFKFLIPLSNISLNVYLLNGHIALFLSEALLKSTGVFSGIDIIYIFFLTYLTAVAGAALMFLFIEVPFHRLSQGKF